jgi:hypothetical protein
MDKRQFLAASLGAAASLPALAQTDAPAAPTASQNDAAAGRGPGNTARGLQSPALLTVTGPTVRANRRTFDPAFDQMMAKQKLAFDKAHAFDFGLLNAMPSTTIEPTLEYDKRKHRLSGPLLVNVLKAAGVNGDRYRLVLRGIDGYSPVVPVAHAAKYEFIVATRLDGDPMPLGGLGPLWVVYEADKFPDMAAKPIEERFALCPWGVYQIEMQPT